MQRCPESAGAHLPDHGKDACTGNGRGRSPWPADLRHGQQLAAKRNEAAQGAF